MSINTQPDSLNAQQSYNDIHQLQKINQLGKANKSAALTEMAKQFESIFLSSMLKQMRQASSVMSEGGMFDSNNMRLYQQMFDQQLALSLSQGKGMGLASMIEAQLKRQYDNQAEANREVNIVGLPERSAFKALTAEFQQAGKSAVQLQQKDSENSVSGMASPEEFVANIMPYAKLAGEKLGVDYKVIIAQAALESGWGKSLNANNLFGIKAGANWQGLSQTKQTKEFIDGVETGQQATFRGYQNYADSFSDYVRFIQQSPRYKTAFQQAEGVNEQGHSARSYIHGLHKAGYATDPEYTDKVMNVYHGLTLTKALNSYTEASAKGGR